MSAGEIHRSLNLLSYMQREAYSLHKAILRRRILIINLKMTPEQVAEHLDEDMFLEIEGIAARRYRRVREGMGIELMPSWLEPEEST